MKILVVGGTHGDEHTGVDVISILRHNPVEDIDTLVANPPAVMANCRFMETDLNRSFGAKQPKSYEEKRATEIVPILQNYDLVLDIHNTISNTTCGMVATGGPPTLWQLAVFSHFRFDRVVVMGGSSALIGQRPSRSVAFEISIHNRDFTSKFMVEKIRNLCHSTEIFELCDATLNVWDGDKSAVTLEDLARVGLKLSDFSDFVPITDQQKQLLHLPEWANYIFVPFLVGEKAYGENFAFRIARLASKDHHYWAIT